MTNSGKTPAVSILTPVYNMAPYLADTIAAALAQTFTDFEMLVVDDGSSDDTLAIARSFAQRDSRVRVLRQANGGTAAARNRALVYSRGRYIALLDGDDRWTPDFLHVQLSILESDRTIDVVSANALNLGGPWDGKLLRPGPDGPIRTISALDLIEVEDSVCIMSIFRRSVVDRIGGFDAAVRRNEDYDYWLRAALAGCTIAFNPRPLGYYRRHAASKSADEEAAIAGIIEVLGKTRRAAAGRPAEIAAIDRQIARFEREQLLAGARSALLKKDFDRAGQDLERLVEAGAAARFHIAAFLTRFIPDLVRRAYVVKLALQSLALRRRRAV